MLSDFLWLLGFVVVWYTLMRYILPACGIPTCMTGACQLKKEDQQENNARE